MKILLIEDNIHKYEKISNAISNKFPNSIIVNAKSYYEACQQLSVQKWNFIIIDMSLPSFNKDSDNDNGGRFRPFGGQEIIRRMHRKKINANYIVITQFTSFSDGGTIFTLDQLDRDFKDADPEFYHGLILFKFNDTSWQDQLLKSIDI